MPAPNSSGKEKDPHWKLLTRFSTDGVWVADGWNTITVTILVDQRMVDAGSTKVYFESKTLYAPDLNGNTSQVLMVIDDVRIQPQYSSTGPKKICNIVLPSMAFYQESGFHNK